MLNATTFCNNWTFINFFLYLGLLICIFIIVVLTRHLVETTKITTSHLKIKNISNELHRLKAKSYDLANTNIVLEKKYDDISSQLVIFKHKQLQNNQILDNLRSQSFDSIDKHQYEKLENEINYLKSKHMFYQKDAVVIKHLVRDILKLKENYNTLSKNILPDSIQ